MITLLLTQETIGFVLNYIFQIWELPFLMTHRIYEALIETANDIPDFKFMVLNTISDTRFAAYSQRAFQAFFKDTRAIIISIEKREMDDFKDSKAIRILRRIANVTFLGTLAGITDIYKVIRTVFSNIQKLNLFLWERINMIKEFIELLTNPHPNEKKT